MIKKPATETVAQTDITKQPAPPAPIAEPMPTKGGSYVRAADGSLSLVEGPADEQGEA